MDENKPPIPPSEFRMRSVFERAAAAIDPARAPSAMPDQPAATEPQGRADGPSVATYYRDAEEVREGFLIALSAMGVAAIEPLPEPAKPSVRGAKP